MSVSERPTELGATCPDCNAMTIAVVPKNSKLVDPEVDADGKVRADCENCDQRFLVHYRTG